MILLSEALTIFKRTRDMLMIMIIKRENIFFARSFIALQCCLLYHQFAQISKAFLHKNKPAKAAALAGLKLMTNAVWVMINGNYRAKTLANLFSQNSSSHDKSKTTGKTNFLFLHFLLPFLLSIFISYISLTAFLVYVNL